MWRRRIRAGLVGLAAAWLPVAAQADWGAFYQGTASGGAAAQRLGPSDMTGMHPRATRRTLPRLAVPTDPLMLRPEFSDTGPLGDPQTLCVTQILQAQQRYGIPDNLLLGIGLQEAGVARGAGLTVWPWAVNAEGVGRIFDSREAAMDWVRLRQAEGARSIDVGCMQINLRWHPDAFASLAEGFDPQRNVDYAARFLLALRAETGSWMAAAGAYHSRTPDKAEIYLASLRRNVAVANDRIARFHDMAGPAFVTMPAALPADALPADAMSAHALPAQALPADTPAAAPLPPWVHGAWSTGAEDDGGVYGIYSRAALEPVLPHFLHDF